MNQLWSVTFYVLQDVAYPDSRSQKEASSEAIHDRPVALPDATVRRVPAVWSNPLRHETANAPGNPLRSSPPDPSPVSGAAGGESRPVATDNGAQQLITTTSARPGNQLESPRQTVQVHLEDQANVQLSLVRGTLDEISSEELKVDDRSAKQYSRIFKWRYYYLLSDVQGLVQPGSPALFRLDDDWSVELSVDSWPGTITVRFMKEGRIVKIYRVKTDALVLGLVILSHPIDEHLFVDFKHLETKH